MGRHAAPNTWEVRIEPLVEYDPNGGCWLWSGNVTKDGYGRYGVGGAGFRYTHREAYRMLVGAISDDLKVCHSCDVPACVNPDHLFLGTHTDNMQDMTRKGRGVAKLSPGDAAAIAARLAAGERVADVHADYPVRLSTIYEIRRGERASLRGREAGVAKAAAGRGGRS